MKNTGSKIIALVFGLFLLSAGFAAALPITGQTIQVSNGIYGKTAGGEFRIDVLDPSTPDFIGFCLELSEYLSYGVTYTIKGVDDFAENGGNGGAVNNKDPLDKKTKWLFFNYLYGNYGWSRGKGSNQAENDLRADNVQNAIWHLEEEKTFNGNPLLSIVNSQTDYSISGRVKVLNFIDADKNFKQSLIVGEHTPEPKALLLMGTGLACLAGYSRRRKKQ